MVVTLESIEKHLKQVDDMLDKIPEHIKRLKKELQLCDIELQDIQHTIELTRFNAHEGWKLARDMQLTLQTRRRVKNDLDGLRRLQTRVKRHSPLVHHTSGAMKIHSEQAEKIKGRVYTPRVRKDLSENGIIFNKEEKNEQV